MIRSKKKPQKKGTEKTKKKKQMGVAAAAADAADAAAAQTGASISERERERVIDRLFTGVALCFFFSLFRWKSFSEASGTTAKKKQKQKKTNFSSFHFIFFKHFFYCWLPARTETKNQIFFFASATFFF